MKIAVIEDYKTDSDFLLDCINKYLTSVGIIYTVDTFDNVDDFPIYQSYDIIFVDILLKDKNGFELARRIRNIHSIEETSIILTTTLAQYAVDGYEIGVGAYILKPFTYKDFVLKTVNIFNRIIKDQDDSITIYTRDKEYINLKLTSLLYIESDAHYLTYVSDGRTYVVRKTLSECEKELNNKGFFRVNNWCIVAIKRIDKISDNSIYIKDKVITVSRARKKDFLKEVSMIYGI